MSFADICKMFHPTSAEYAFFPASHGTLSKIDQMLDHKESPF
jgi:hypothetical protein